MREFMQLSDRFQANEFVTPFRTLPWMADLENVLPRQTLTPHPDYSCAPFAIVELGGGNVTS